MRCFEVVGARVAAFPEALTIGVYGHQSDCGAAVQALAVVQLPESAAAKRIEHAPAGTPSNGP